MAAARNGRLYSAYQYSVLGGPDVPLMKISPIYFNAICMKDGVQGIAELDRAEAVYNVLRGVPGARNRGGSGGGGARNQGGAGDIGRGAADPVVAAPVGYTQPEAAIRKALQDDLRALCGACNGVEKLKSNNIH